MTRLIPHPLLSLGLLVMWLLLTRFSLGQLLLGGAVALLAGRALSAIEPRGPRVRRPLVIASLVCIAAGDIFVSNLRVARRILRGARPEAPPGFVEVTLRLRDPAPVAVLALILSAAPGSAWIAFDATTGRLLLHILERDGTDWPAMIRDRYEARLLEIFA